VLIIVAGGCLCRDKASRKSAEALSKFLRPTQSELPVWGWLSSEASPACRCAVLASRSNAVDITFSLLALVIVQMRFLGILCSREQHLGISEYNVTYFAPDSHPHENTSENDGGYFMLVVRR
jgi:hypothetical protein